MIADRAAASRARPMFRAASALAAGLLGLMLSLNLLDTEAGGGQLTGPLIRLCLGGSAALLLAAALAITRRPVASALAAVAALLCLPLLAHRVAPGLFASLSDVPASVAYPERFTLDSTAVAGLVAIGLLALSFIRPAAPRS